MTGSELVAENSQEHLPVLLQEAVSHLLSGSGASAELSEPSDVFVDATFGRGGHSREILKQLTPNSRLIGLDRDPEAVIQGAVLAAQDQRFSIHQARFSELSQVLDELKIGSVQGILMDIGVSSPQLDNAERGFSFAADGPLDMRMNPTEGQ